VVRTSIRSPHATAGHPAKETTMSHLTNPAARLLLALSAVPAVLLLPTSAAADAGTPSTKAQIEHAELQSAGTTSLTKAQIEHSERTSATATGATTTTTRTTTVQPVGISNSGSSGSGDAAAWQLALSAALGAAVTGGALVTARQVSAHRHPLAS